MSTIYDYIDEFDFEPVDSGASFVSFEDAGQIRISGHLLIKGKPCKVVAVSTCQDGKHGHAKCCFTAVDIFTGKKYEDVVSSTHTVEVPTIVRSEYTLLDIASDGFLTLMNTNGECRCDIPMPKHPAKLAQLIQDRFDNDKELLITVLSAMGTEQVVACRVESH